MAAKTVAWSGFGPFGEGETRIETNPSQRLVELLGAEFPADATKIVDVSMAAAEQCAVDCAESEVCVHVGVAATYKKITLERRAHNEAAFSCADESGSRPQGDPIAKDCPETALDTTIDVETLRSELRGRGFDVAVSDDPGRFVCNYLYFHSLRRSKCCLFVHVPPFDVVSEATQFATLRALRELLLREQPEPPEASGVAGALKELGVSDADARRAVDRGARTVDEAFDLLFGGRDDETKLVLVVRTDVAMSKGKVAAQAAHAALGAYRAAVERNPSTALEWIDGSREKTVVCAAPSSQPWHTFLSDTTAHALRAGVPTHLVHDAGRTEVQPGTATVIALGPALAAHIDPITRHLSLLQ